MANRVFNVAKGMVNAYHDRVVRSDPATSALLLIILQSCEDDDALDDYATISALLASAGNVEADFTNYERKVIAGSQISLSSVDNTSNQRSADFSDQIYSLAGGVLDNALLKLIVCYEPNTSSGTDADLVPLTHHDFVATTDGQNLKATVNAAGYFRA